MPDQYTHNFIFRVGEDGSKFLEGEVEFDTDGKTSYRFTSQEGQLCISQPLPADTLKVFDKLMSLCEEIFKTQGGIKRISVKRKAT